MLYSLNTRAISRGVPKRLGPTEQNVREREAATAKSNKAFIHFISIRPSEVPRSRLFTAPDLDRRLRAFLGVVRVRETQETRLAVCVQRGAPALPGIRPRREFFLLASREWKTARA